MQQVDPERVERALAHRRGGVAEIVEELGQQGPGETLEALVAQGREHVNEDAERVLAHLPLGIAETLADLAEDRRAVHVAGELFRAHLRHR